MAASGKRSLALRCLPGLVQAYRRLPLKPFKGVLASVFERYAKRYRNETLIIEIEGVRYELDLGEEIDRAIYFLGAFEPATSAALVRLAQPGMTVVDIGANIG